MIAEPQLVGINIYLERRKTRLLVGHLKMESSEYVFTYNERYLHLRNVIPLGPEFPMTKRSFRSWFRGDKFVEHECLNFFLHNLIHKTFLYSEWLFSMKLISSPRSPTRSKRYTRSL